MNGEMRILDSEIGKVVPVVDIAEMIGYHRSSITKAIDANEEAFRDLKTFQRLPTAGGSQPFLCLNEIGVERLFLVISPSSKTKKDLFKRVEEFRLKAFGNLTEHKQLTNGNGNGHDLNSEITKAKMLAQATGGDVLEFQAIALAKCGYSDYIPALKTAQVNKGESGWFNPTQLVTLCNDPLLNAERLNYYLANNPRDPERRPFQYRDENRIWRLTPLGMEHGREYIFRGIGGHTEPRIEWRESILYASGLLKRQDSNQLSLAVRA